MPARYPIALAIAALVAAALAGCGSGGRGGAEAGVAPDSAAGQAAVPEARTGGAAGVPKKIVIPAGVAGTVAEYVDLIGVDELLVKGYGIVVGLGLAGSDEVPQNIRSYLIDEMYSQGLGSYRYGTRNLEPREMLRDKDTAVVVVGGRIPPGAPAGTHFDLHVEALPGSQTTSLDGGVLLGTKLRLALTTAAGPASEVKTLALAQGAVFVNPFIDRTKVEEQVKLRSGSIPGGGAVAQSRDIRLELRRGDYRLARLIERRLNRRFGGEADVAEAKSHAFIELRIPRPWRKDYAHFLDLVMHVYLPGGPAEEEMHAKQLAEAILQPTARHEDISLVWEAMGRQVLPVLQPLYTSPNQAAAYYACRAGLRLEDALALDGMISFAQEVNSPHQISAIGELGRARWSVRPVHALRAMLSSANELVRVAAYEALLDHGPTSAIQRVRIADQFYLDVVDTDRHYAVYVTRTGQPKIALFGRNIPVLRPLFYCPPDELVTINASQAERQVQVYRKVPRTGQMSGTLRVEPQADALVRKLGSVPERNVDGSIEGLGLTYSQVVGVLHGLCRQKHLPAEFVLQRTPELARIYMATPAQGRSDAPEEGP